MMPPDNIRHIARIYDTPGHRHYGPARRLWMVLEQLLADEGGVERFETRLRLHQATLGIYRPAWDEHLHQLIAQGQSEASAQRMVIQQLLLAREWIA
jgi:hypothetical protein